ncbi:hypothetical protein RRSWK_02843 [Rhodopirellula sp. SWK7]|nr:hypothetical protein RRSWK_02843 [Rhodopirellula sp. SWK7]
MRFEAQQSCESALVVWDYAERMDDARDATLKFHQSRFERSATPLLKCQQFGWRGARAGGIYGSRETSQASDHGMSAKQRQSPSEVTS